MAKCIECGHALSKTVGDHVYRESGLDNVILHDVTRLACTACGAKRVEIQAMAQLHRALAAAILGKPARLEAAEVRFLRDHLGLTNAEFAALMGVTASQASRWTTTEQIGTVAERLLRMLATLGPSILKAEPVSGPQATQTVEDLGALISKLPATADSVESVPIYLRRARAGWKQVAGASSPG